MGGAGEHPPFVLHRQQTPKKRKETTPAKLPCASSKGFQMSKLARLLLNCPATWEDAGARGQQQALSLPLNCLVEVLLAGACLRLSRWSEPVKRPPQTVPLAWWKCLMLRTLLQAASNRADYTPLCSQTLLLRSAGLLDSKVGIPERPQADLCCPGVSWPADSE
eukprot:scaffold162419_cov17-Tisochrysis_lutea.AAC.1